MNNQYRRDRLRHHVLFTRARLSARAPAWRTAHAAPLRRLIAGRLTTGGLIIGGLAIGALVVIALATVTSGPTDDASHPASQPAGTSTAPPATAPAVTAPAVTAPAEAPSTAPAGPPTPATGLVVRRGETLAVIAVRVGIPVERLAAYNRQSDPDRITTGQHLRLPPPPGPADPGPTVVIAPGDTLTGLARTHHVTPTALLAANPDLTDPDHIQAGAGLRVPTAAPPRSAGVGSGQRSR